MLVAHYGNIHLLNIATRLWRAYLSLGAYLPRGPSHRRQTAAKAPAEAPDILLTSKLEAYFFRQAATPTW